MISKYSKITWYVPALIHKFAGLAMIQMGDVTGGPERLDPVIRFFDVQLDPVLRLLGVTVRVERSLYFLQKGQLKRICPDLEKIKKDLGMQKDIKRFFNEELKTISRYLRLRKLGEKEKGIISEALDSLQKQIPY